MNNADRVFVALVAFSNYIPTPNANADGHIKLSTIGNRCNHMIGVDEGKFGGNLQVGTGNRARAFCRHMGSCLNSVFSKYAKDQTLYVQNNIGNVFNDTFGCRELMLHTVDLNGGSGSAVKGVQQHAAHSIAERIPIATLERIHNETSNGIADFFRGDRRPHELCHM